jgi:hypothetical protein
MFLQESAQMRRLALAILMSGVMSVFVPLGGFAQDARSFDGNWAVTRVCGPTSDGARGYSWNFSGQIANGMFRGVYGTERRPPWLRLEGPIAPDGSAMLIAQGQSNNPDYAVGHVRAGTPLNYRVEARFSGQRGSGKRLDNRPCDLTFVRQ